MLNIFDNNCFTDSCVRLYILYIYLYNTATVQPHAFMKSAPIELAKYVLDGSHTPRYTVVVMVMLIGDSRLPG
jgi:hypothetical protein